MRHYRLLLILSITLLLFPPIRGENTKSETLLWTNQGIEFEVPKGVQITGNTKDSFTAEFDDFYIEMTLFTPPVAHDKSSDIATLQELCAKMNVEIVDSGTLDNKGLPGVWVEGPMMSGPMMLMGLLSNDKAKVAILCKIIYYPNLGEYADNVLDSIHFNK